MYYQCLRGSIIFEVIGVILGRWRPAALTAIVKLHAVDLQQLLQAFAMFTCQDCDLWVVLFDVLDHLHGALAVVDRNDKSAGFIHSSRVQQVGPRGIAIVRLYPDLTQQVDNVRLVVEYHGLETV